MERDKNDTRHDVRQVIGDLKRALRIEEPLTDEEPYQLPQLSEAIVNYEGCGGCFVIGA